jgi:hypothetical protein
MNDESGMMNNKEVNSMEDVLTIHIPDEIRQKLNRTPEEMGKRCVNSH